MKKNIKNTKTGILENKNLFYSFINNNFSSINKNQYNTIYREIIDNIFDKVELKVNEFIAYFIIPHLIYDMDNPLYDIKYENN